MISYDEALQQLLQAATSVAPIERVAVEDALGRVLAQDVISPQALPPFDNAAMDGFALRLAGTPCATGARAVVVGWHAAGDPAADALGDAADGAANGAADGAAGAGIAWEIMTGARMPAGLDTVIPIEQVDILESVDGRPTRIALRAALELGQHVRLRGQDVDEDEQVLAAGQVLDLNALTLLRAVGIADVAVRASVRTAVISTGKELVTNAAQSLQSGQIRDSNRPFLVGRLHAAGSDVVWQGTVSDDVPAFNAALDAALAAGARVVLSTGAVSQGRYDFIPDALRDRGATIVFHKVAIRPGKPLLFARLACGALYFGLPGNPISAAVGQRFFVEPVLRQLQGLAREQGLRLPLHSPVRTPPGLRFHARARVALDAQGRLSARVLSGQESFRLKTTLQANAWVVIESGGSSVPAGTTVHVHGWGHLDPVQLTDQETA